MASEKFPEAEKALGKAKIQLMARPESIFYTSVCLSMKHIFDSTIPTACTNGLEIRYNPDFFMGLSVPERVFLLLHETLHVAFHHVTRSIGREAGQWNVAADYVINDLLIGQGFKMPDGGLHDTKYRDMTTEAVYEKIKKDPPPPDFQKDIVTPGTGNGPQDPSAPSGSGAAPMSPAALKNAIDDILVRAKTMAEMSNNTKAIGNVPGEVAVYLKELAQPQMPWYRILRKFFNSTVKTDFTFRKPNRRYFPDMLLPSQSSEAIGTMMIAVDTSGSISQEQFDHFISETFGILRSLKPKEIKFIQFDTSIKAVDSVKKVTDLQRIEFKGRGGTNVFPVIDWIIENKPKISLIFTDGEFRMPTEVPKTPVIWMIHSNDRFRAPFGKVIKYVFKK